MAKVKRPKTTEFLVVVAIAAGTGIPSFADPVDKNTPCAVAIQAFDSDRRAGQVLAGAASPQVQELGNYIMDVMAQLDRQFTDSGKEAVWSSFSDAGKRAVAASAVANCRLHPDRTIDQAANAVFLAVRDMHIQLGIVK